jgi:hypothetical protein
MKKIFKWIGLALEAVVIIIIFAVLYITVFLPNIPVQQVSAGSSPARIIRGKYLANHVTVCIDCHSTRDWSKFSGPLVPGTEGKGGDVFDQRFGFPGRFVAPNITQAKLKDWSDGEIYRAITSGVNSAGKALFPLMPCSYYSQMDKEDILSIIAYIKTLKPIDYTPDKSTADFPFNIILHTIPALPHHTPKPDTSDKVAYGKYLVTAAGCVECHTPVNHDKIIPEKSFSGGREFPMPFGTVVATNLTPDKKTGLGAWTKEYFIEYFKSFDPALHQPKSVKPDEFNSVMPWTMFAGMTTSDLEAIFTYLQTLPPITSDFKTVKK